MKRPLSLVEIIIGLFLALLLLSTLFRSYYDFASTKAQIETARTSLHSSLFLRGRLDSLFAKINPEKKCQLTKEKLLFYFEMGVDHDPEFSKPMKATLFYDKKDQFILSFHPEENNSLERKEVLQKGVKTLQIRFWDPKRKQWSSTWTSSEFPLQIQLTLNKETMTFLIQTAKHEVIYR